MRRFATGVAIVTTSLDGRIHGFTVNAFASVSAAPPTVLICVNRIATAHPDRVAALAGFHAGGLVTDDEDSPHRSASELTAEVYLGHADNDPSMTPENIAALEHALDEADVTYSSEVYEGAAHGYTMADTSMYDEAAAERHFDALFALLDRTI